jgi:glyoxylase-like metal-dependent hydrolase (beta-lactamase superfamily II)
VNPLVIGEVRIDRLVELEGLGYEPGYFFPDSTEDGFAAEMEWLAPHFWDVAANTYKRAIQSYVVRTARHTVLVDSCVGDGKARPSTPAWDGLRSSWLDRLAALGVAPEAVDYVLCTHLHADHVGWNTRLANGRWVPTFRNAKYLFHKDELRHWQENGDPLEGPGTMDGAFEDSVLPVIAAGRATLVDNDFAIDDALVLEPTPGHSPGHVCLDVRAGGRHAIVSGDVLHHPIQVARPEWNSRFCVDPDLSRATRKAFVERHADAGDVILAAHFASPTAGRIVANGPRCKFEVMT